MHSQKGYFQKVQYEGCLCTPPLVALIMAGCLAWKNITLELNSDIHQIAYSIQQLVFIDNHFETTCLETQKFSSTNNMYMLSGLFEESVSHGENSTLIRSKPIVGSHPMRNPRLFNLG